MTFADVLRWCRENHADVRGIFRGRDVSISHKDAELPAERPPIDAIFHWDIEMPELNHYVSSSDFERIIAGKLTVADFKSTLRGRE